MGGPHTRRKQNSSGEREQRRKFLVLSVLITSSTRPEEERRKVQASRGKQNSVDEPWWRRPLGLSLLAMQRRSRTKPSILKLLKNPHILLNNQCRNLCCSPFLSVDKRSSAVTLSPGCKAPTEPSPRPLPGLIVGCCMNGGEKYVSQDSHKRKTRQL